jgi:hypothetical protein
MGRAVKLRIWSPAHRLQSNLSPLRPGSIYRAVESPDVGPVRRRRRDIHVSNARRKVPDGHVRIAQEIVWTHEKSLDSGKKRTSKNDRRIAVSEKNETGELLTQRDAAVSAPRREGKERSGHRVTVNEAASTSVRPRVYKGMCMPVPSCSVDIDAENHSRL